MTNLICNYCDSTEQVKIYNIDDLSFHLCPTCAGNNGFCIGCGWMMAGSESNENSGIRYMCYECANEIFDELREGDD